MENKIENLKNLMRQQGATEEQIDTLISNMEKIKEEVMDKIEQFETPRIHTDREEKIYKTAEKVLDKVFNGYGVIKDKAIPGAKEKTRSFRSWLAKKIEPKS